MHETRIHLETRIGQSTWSGKNVPPAPRNSVGLFHLAELDEAEDRDKG